MIRYCMPALALLALTLPALAEPTYGERLGFKADDRVLIIHCDDVGMSLANNEAAAEALDYGLVTSVSVMMPCPWVPGWLPYMKANPETDMGLHLTLTSEYDHFRWGPLGALAKKVWEGGLPVLDHVHSDSYNWKTTDIDEKVAHYVDAIENLKPGITYMIIHCTMPNDVIGKINGNRDFLYGDYLAMIDPRTKKAIEDEGIILTTMKELKSRRDKVGKE